MADLATPSAAQKGNFTNGKRGEVIVKHEALLGFTLEDLKSLHVVAGAESGGHQGLGFASGKNRGTVGTRQYADFDPNVANLIEGAAIGTPLLLDHGFAEDPFTKSFVVGLQLGLRGFVVFRNRGYETFFEFFDQGVAFGLRVLFSVETISEVAADLLFQIVVIRLIELRRGHFPLWLAGLFPQLVDRRANFLDFSVSEVDGVNDGFFLHLFGTRFDHHDTVSGPDHHDVQ